MHRSCIALLLAFSCDSAPPHEEPPAEPTPGERFCGEVGKAIDRCGGSDCDRALVTDCAVITGLVNEPLLVDGASCLVEGGAPAECLLSALDGASPTDAHRAFAQSFCDNCALGVPGCTGVFFDGSSGDTGIAGKIVLPFGDSLVAALTEKCTSGFTCAATFQSCAQQTLIEEGLPTESAQCFLETLISGAAPSCGSMESDAGTEDGGTEDGGTEDAGTIDSGTRDGGIQDTGTADTGEVDGGPVCSDPHEPNATRANAFDLGSIGDNSPFPAGVVEASVGDRDFDWFTFELNDEIIGGAGPRAGIDAFGSPAGAGFSVCIYYECNSGLPAVECSEGALSVYDGLSGCCASGSTAALVELVPNCPGLIGTAGRAWVRVEGIGEPVCDLYSLRWGG